ncbi:MAG: hypothetical protein AAGA54_33890 [Myxococcota bacterium]
MSDSAHPHDDAASARPLTRVRAAVLGSVGLAALVAIPMVVRVHVEGTAALASAKQTDDVDLRIERYGQAARWRSPFGAHDDAALDALVAMGDDPEREVALAALREARRAMLGTRAWGLSDPARYATVNESIATHMAAAEAEAQTDVGGHGDAYAYHLRLLQAVPGPDPVRANGAAFAFAGWLVALVGFVLRGIDASGRLQARAATRWGLAALVLLVSWCVLLAIA